MKGYLVVHVEVQDPEVFETYRVQVPEVLAKFGGRYLVRGGTAHPLEGDWKVPRLVIVEFDTVDAAKTFYNSPEYQEILALRLKASRSDAAIVEGFVG